MSHRLVRSRAASGLGAGRRVRPGLGSTGPGPDSVGPGGRKSRLWSRHVLAVPQGRGRFSCPTHGSWPTSPLVIASVNAAAQRVKIRAGRKVTVVGRDGGLARQHNPRVVAGPLAVHAGTAQPLSVPTGQPRQAPGPSTAKWVRPGGSRRPSPTYTNRPTGPKPSAGSTTGCAAWKGPGSPSSRPQPASSTREQILNYFDDRQTNAFAEGITNKIGVMKRRGYGHRRSDRYRHKVQHLPDAGLRGSWVGRRRGRLGSSWARRRSRRAR